MKDLFGSVLIVFLFLTVAWFFSQDNLPDKAKPLTKEEDSELNTYIQKTDAKITSLYLVHFFVRDFNVESCKKAREQYKDVKDFHEVVLDVNGEKLEFTCEEFLELFKRLKQERKMINNMDVGHK